jgi:hypothetical protein
MMGSPSYILSNFGCRLFKKVCISRCPQSQMIFPMFFNRYLIEKALDTYLSVHKTMFIFGLNV